MIGDQFPEPATSKQQQIMNKFALIGAAGFLELKKARVRGFLSIDQGDSPHPPGDGKLATYRSLTLDGQEIEFSEGFKNLHTRTYEEILVGRGFGLDDAKPAVDIVSTIRRSEPVGLQASTIQCQGTQEERTQ